MHSAVRTPSLSQLINTDTRFSPVKTIEQARLKGKEDCRAVKRIPRKSGMSIDLHPLRAKNLRREVEFLRRHSEPFIPGGLCLRDKDHYYLEMDCAHGGDLAALVRSIYLSTGMKEGLPEAAVHLYLTQLGAQVLLLHREDLVHRDLKLDNAVFMPDGCAKASLLVSAHRGCKD